MITIDDQYRFEDLGLKVLDVYDDPSSASFVENLVQVPRNDTTLLISEQSRPRTIRLVANMHKSTLLDIEVALNNLMDLFYDNEGKRKKIKLRLDHWQGKFVYAYIAAEIKSDRKRHLVSVELNFICYDPSRYSEVLASEVTWGSELIDFTSNYSLGHEGSPVDTQVTGSTETNISLSVDGLNVHPKIIINGSSDDLQIIANGETINVPSFNNSKWVIEQFTTTKNGQEVFINSRKFKLVRGSNDVILRGNNKDFKISFEFRDRYK